MADQTGARTQAATHPGLTRKVSFWRVELTTQLLYRLRAPPTTARGTPSQSIQPCDGFEHRFALLRAQPDFGTDLRVIAELLDTLHRPADHVLGHASTRPENLHLHALTVVDNT